MQLALCAAQVLPVAAMLCFHGMYNGSGKANTATAHYRPPCGLK